MNHYIIDPCFWSVSDSLLPNQRSDLLSSVFPIHNSHHHFSNGAPGDFGAFLATFSNSMISESLSRNPRHPMTLSAWLLFFAPGIGTVFFDMQ